MNAIISKIDDLTYQRRTIIWYKILYFRALWRNGFKKKVILFYPMKPHMWHVIYLICNSLGYVITNDPRARFDLAMAFEDTTVREKDRTLSDLLKTYTVLNGHCDDISKARVNKVFAESFGYGTTIDPRTYWDVYVKKIDTNGLHQAELLDKPSEPEKGFVYQKLIDSQMDKDSVLDIRTFIFGDSIPFTLYRKHSVHDRFRDGTIVAWRVDTDKAFTREEQASIIRFCKAFGLDYGELDILRDNKDGKIYVVDVNNTPSGPRPGVHMKKEDYELFVAELSAAFEKMARENIVRNSSHIAAV